MMKSNLLYAVSLILSLTVLTSCDKDELGDSILSDSREELDPNSYSYKFDKWLEDEYLLPYNMDFRYKMQDVGADMEYNLVPTTYQNSQDMALLTKYLWFDVYGEVVNETFLKENGPRIIHLIGSPAFNPVSGTMILGLAEGGIKISLYRCNSLDYSDVEMMNEYYFKTMHHEFAHILHQTRTYPSDFNLISNIYYSPLDWQSRRDEIAASLGFASPYAGSENREDFVEVIANYIVKTDKQWDTLLDIASKGWSYDEGTNKVTQEKEDRDGVDGRETILKKLKICKKWLMDDWGIDLEKLREEVQIRQAKINETFLKEVLRKQIEEISIPETNVNQ